MASPLTADELRTQIQQEDDAAAQISASLENEKRELLEAKARQALRRELEARAEVTANKRRTLNSYQHFRSSIDSDQAGELSGAAELFSWQPPKLTRTPRGLRTVRTGYAYPPPACCTYRRRRAACPVLYVLRTRTSLGRAVRTCRVPRTVLPCTVYHRMPKPDKGLEKRKSKLAKSTLAYDSDIRKREFVWELAGLSWLPCALQHESREATNSEVFEVTSDDTNPVPKTLSLPLPLSLTLTLTPTLTR